MAIGGSKESMNAARHAIGLAKKDGAQLIALTAMRFPSLYGWSPAESPYTWQKKYTKERSEIIFQFLRPHPSSYQLRS